jgi:hypothetical protein
VVIFVRVVGVEGVTYNYSQIDCLSIIGFVRVLGVEGVTYIY